LKTLILFTENIWHETINPRELAKTSPYFTARVTISQEKTNTTTILTDII